MVHQNSPTMEMRANTERSMDFRKANREQSVHFWRVNKETYWKYNVNLSKRLRKDRVFFRLAGLFLGISLKRCPRKIPRSSPPALGKPCPSLLCYLD